MFCNSKAIVSVAANAPATVVLQADDSDNINIKKLFEYFCEWCYRYGYMYGTTLLKIDDVEEIPLSPQIDNGMKKGYNEFIEKLPSESSFYSVLNSISTVEDVIQQLDWEAISKSPTKNGFPIYGIFCAGVADGLTRTISFFLLQGDSLTSNEFDYVNSNDPQKMQNRVDELFKKTTMSILSELDESN